MLLREQRTPPLSRPNFCLSLCPLLFWLCATATYRHVCIDGQGVARSAYARTYGGLLLAESNTPSSHVRGDWTVHQPPPHRHHTESWDRWLGASVGRVQRLEVRLNLCLDLSQLAHLCNQHRWK